VQCVRRSLGRPQTGECSLTVQGCRPPHKKVPLVAHLIYFRLGGWHLVTRLADAARTRSERVPDRGRYMRFLDAEQQRTEPAARPGASCQSALRRRPSTRGSKGGPAVSSDRQRGWRSETRCRDHNAAWL
jgi:hypothetical protein